MPIAPSPTVLILQLFKFQGFKPKIQKPWPRHVNLSQKGHFMALKSMICTDIQLHAFNTGIRQ
uniref:Uncharacterized protein n=1 Tax=Anguilla anguilla TaxID=7936 RepID=A0A0E9WN81_ANGAN